MQFVPYASFPTELAAYSPFSASPSYRFGYALTIYSGDYLSTATYGQVIYWWMAMAQSPITHENYLFIGHSFVADANVSTTPTVHILWSALVNPAPNTGNSGLYAQGIGQFNANGLLIWNTGDDLTGGCATNMYNAFGGTALNLLTDVYLDNPTHTIVGGAVISYADPGPPLLPQNPMAFFPDLTITQNATAGVAAPATRAPIVFPPLETALRPTADAASWSMGAASVAPSDPDPEGPHQATN